VQGRRAAWAVGVDYCSARAMTDSLGVTALPEGPSEVPVLQTARWLIRPIAFLESCRRRFGDTFRVRFVGMRTPLVMLSDPAAVRALYSERENGLPAL
jgi:hypothetical protein